MSNDYQNKSDRDLLIITVTEIGNIKEDLKRGTKKMDKHNDILIKHDRRITKVEDRECPTIPPNEATKYIKIFGILLSILMLSFGFLNYLKG